MSQQRLVLIIAILACLVPSEQAISQQDSTSAVVPVGTSTFRLVLTVAEPPAPKDSIEATVSTAQVTTALILPNGHRITADNAESEGITWSKEFGGPAPLGSEDYGQHVQVTFRKRAPAGRYTFEFAFQQLREPARVKAHFTSRMGDYLALMRATPGAQISKPVPFSPSATVILDLANDEEDMMFDVVVPDAATDVMLVLPDGRKLKRDEAKNADVNWTVEADPKESFFGYFLPMDGVHQFIGLKKAAKGRYEIYATPKTPEKGEMRVAAIPMKRFGEARGAKFKATELGTGEISSSGGVQIRPQRLPYECYVGDKLDFQIELVGDVGPQRPEFEVRSERRAWVRDTDTGIELAPPDPAEVMPVQLTEIAPRTYRGTVIPSKPGWVRISVKATGTTTSGKPFTTETLLTNSSIQVKSVAARFIGLTARPVAKDAASKFDRLEVTATLDVLIPGEYLMDFGVQDAAGSRLEKGGGGRATLQAGRQELTVSVPSSGIWRDLRDGPLEISGVVIYRTQKSTMSWIKVPTENATFRTAAYRHDQWNPGEVYGEDHVTVRGIDPDASGKFRFAEVEWEVTTPGLMCNWNAALRGAYRPPYTVGNPQPRLDASQTGTLPAGKTKVSFLFDGAAIHRFGKQDWTLWAGLSCGDSEYDIGHSPPFSWRLTPNQKVDLNPDEYAPSRGSFWVAAEPVALRLSPGASETTYVWVGGKKDVQFALADVPKGVDAVLIGARVSADRVSTSLRITPSPETPPGRYFLSVAATSGTEVQTTKVVLDVVPK